MVEELMRGEWVNVEDAGIMHFVKIGLV